MFACCALSFQKVLSCSKVSVEVKNEIINRHARNGAHTCLVRPRNSNKVRVLRGRNTKPNDFAVLCSFAVVAHF